MTDILRQILAPVSVLALLATVPGVVELLIVTTGAWRRRERPVAESAPDFSLAVIVPAHNEEALIGRCVASLLASAQAAPASRCTVVVVADNCADSTAVRAQAAGARVLVRENALQRGKGFALRFAFDSLMAEDFDGFLIVDADSVVSANLVGEIVRGLAGGSDAMQARYRVTPPLDSERKRLMDVALLAFNVLRPRGRSGWGLSAGILGNGFALSRSTLMTVPYSADSIVEDLEYHLMLVTARRKVDFSDSATVYGDMPNDPRAQESQRARWEGGRARVAMAWIPRLAARLLGGKWFLAEPLLELMTLPVANMAVLALLLCFLPGLLFRSYGLFVLCLLGVHVGSSVALGGNVRASLTALASAPAYVFWKLTRMGAILKSSRSEAQWLRTPRATDAKEEAPRV